MNRPYDTVRIESRSITSWISGLISCAECTQGRTVIRIRVEVVSVVVPRLGLDARSSVIVGQRSGKQGLESLHF